MARIAVVGSLSRDRVDGAPPRPGGGPFHAARGIRLLGVPAVLAAKCAAGDRRELLPALAALGLPVTWVPGRATPTFAISYDGEARTMSVEAVGDPWTAAEADELARGALARIEWLHVAPVLRSDFPADALAGLARDRRLSLDGQGLVRRPEVGPLALDSDFDPEVLAFVHVLKLAEEEAKVLVGDDLDPQALAALGPPEVLVTQGSRGSVVIAEGEAVPVRAHAIHGVDPTGAGDAFAAAYIAAREARLRPVAAARRATALVAGLLAGRG